MMSEDLEINGRQYNFDYKEQASRTLILISSATWDEQDRGAITRLRELLAVRLVVDPGERLPRMLFVQKKQPNGDLQSVPVEELKRIIKICLEEI